MHGGSPTVGNRTSWFLLDYTVRDFAHFVTAYNVHEGRLSIRGLVLVSTEHRLMPHLPGGTRTPWIVE